MLICLLLNARGGFTEQKFVKDIFPVELNIPNRESKLLQGYGAGRKSALEGMLAWIVPISPN